MAEQSTQEYSIYTISSKIDERVYFGISNNPTRRFNEHRKKSKEAKPRQIIYKAIQKHGIDNFEFSVIEGGLSKLDAINKEFRLIALYNTRDIRYGFNLDKGGRLLGKVPKGDNHKMYGTKRTLTPEHLEKLRQANLGRKRSPEECAKSSQNRRKAWASGVYEAMVERKRKPKPELGKRVYCYDLSGNFVKDYVSVAEAARECGISEWSYRRIFTVLKDRWRTSLGFYWRYEKTEKCEDTTKPTPKPRAAKRVESLDSQDNRVVFDSARAAAEYLGVDDSNIVRACHGKLKTCKGFTWKYVS